MFQGRENAVKGAPVAVGARSFASRELLAGWWIGLAVALAVVMTSLSAQARSAPESFADLADKLLPSVVNISTTQVVRGRTGQEMPQLPPGLEEFFKEFMERGQPRTPRRATSLGSGFIIDNNGHVVTNNHVIEGADEITVILHDDTRLPATVVGRDPKTDIAVLKVEPNGKMHPVEMGDSDATRVGDWVIAIGNPFGLGGTVTAGIISARGRDINSGPYDDFLQTDASINRGNSGGPMFDMAGRVIGVNTAIFSPSASGGSVGIGFAVPSTTVEPVIRQLIKFGAVKRGWLGVYIQGVTDQIAEALGLDAPRGALITKVTEGGPAQKAGIRQGDVVLSFDGRDVPEMRKLPRIVADTEVGRTVDVEVWREKKMVTLDVVVGELKETESEVAAAVENQETSIARLGLTLSALTPAVRDQFDLPDTAEGVVITGVDENSEAAEKGLRPGDLISDVNQQKVATPDDVAEKVESARQAGSRSIVMLVEGQGGARYIPLRIGDN